MGRKYEYAEWLQFECEGVELSAELKKLGEKFGERAIEVATAFFHSLYGPQFERHGINYDDNALIWNTYASIVGHGVGLWEEDGDTGLPPELEGKLDVIVKKDKKLVSLADQIQGECAGLKQDAGVEEKHLQARDYDSADDALAKVYEFLGAEFYTRDGDRITAYIPVDLVTGQAFDAVKLFKAHGLFHWPDDGFTRVKKVPDGARPTPHPTFDTSRRFRGEDSPRGGGPLDSEEARRRGGYVVSYTEAHRDPGAAWGYSYTETEAWHRTQDAAVRAAQSLSASLQRRVTVYKAERDGLTSLVGFNKGQVDESLADLREDAREGMETSRFDTNWAVEWINPTTKKRQIYLDDMSQRNAEIEARTLRMHHPDADVRVVRRAALGRESPQGSEPLKAEGILDVFGSKKPQYEIWAKYPDGNVEFQRRTPVKAEAVDWLDDYRNGARLSGSKIQYWMQKEGAREDSPQGGEPSGDRLSSSEVTKLPVGSILAVGSPSVGWNFLIVVPGGLAPIYVLAERAGRQAPDGEPASQWGNEFVLVSQGRGQVPTHGTAQRAATTWLKSQHHATHEARSSFYGLYRAKTVQDAIRLIRGLTRRGYVAYRRPEPGDERQRADPASKAHSKVVVTSAPDEVVEETRLALNLDAVEPIEGWQGAREDTPRVEEPGGEPLLRETEANEAARRGKAEKLEQWYTTKEYGDPYEAPEAKAPLVVGFRSSDGRKIMTSQVVEAKGKRIVTLSGSVYELGQPDRGFLEHLRKIGHKFDPKHPIKLMKGARDNPRVGGPSQRSSEAREVSSIHAEGDAVPWVRITRDPKLYEEGIKRAKEIGPIENGKQIYELLSPALAEENQEVFLVVLCNLRQECIGVAEVHRGERSRVSVSRADVLQVVTKSGADHFHVVHNHPSGDPTPSPADRELTEAIQSGADEVEIPCVDHVVIGMGKFYSFAEGKVTKVR